MEFLVLSANKPVYAYVDGPECAGKSSSLDTLKGMVDMPLLVTRQPGFTPLGERLRPLIFDRAVSICPEAQALLFCADRMQAAHETKVLLDSGVSVIQDRGLLSTIVYQHLLGGVPREVIDATTRMADNITGEQKALILYTDLDITLTRFRERELSSPRSHERYKGEDNIRRQHACWMTLFDKQDPNCLNTYGRTKMEVATWIAHRLGLKLKNEYNSY
jgi:thymidylate kinase